MRASGAMTRRRMEREMSYLAVILFGAFWVSVVLLVRWMGKRGRIKVAKDSEEINPWPLLNPGTGLLMGRNGVDIGGHTFGTQGVSSDD